MFHKLGYRHYYIAVLNLVVYNYRVTSTLKADCIDVHNYVTEVADYLPFSLIVSCLTADITGIKTNTIGTLVRLFDYYESNCLAFICGVAKSMKMSV